MTVFRRNLWIGTLVCLGLFESPLAGAAKPRCITHLIEVGQPSVSRRTLTWNAEGFPDGHVELQVHDPLRPFVRTFARPGNYSSFASSSSTQVKDLDYRPDGETLAVITEDGGAFLLYPRLASATDLVDLFRRFEQELPPTKFRGFVSVRFVPRADVLELRDSSGAMVRWRMKGFYEPVPERDEIIFKLVPKGRPEVVTPEPNATGLFTSPISWN